MFTQEATGDGGKTRQWQKDLPEIPERPSGEDSFANLFIRRLPLLQISLFNELIDDTGWERHHWDWIPGFLTRPCHNGHGLTNLQAWTNLGGHPSPSKPRHGAREWEIRPLQKDLKALFLQSVGMGREETFQPSRSSHGSCTIGMRQGQKEEWDKILQLCPLLLLPI